MIQLKQLITEQTAATKYCKQDVLSKPQFSADKWKMIGIWSNRNIGNTDRKSEHAYGNAIDWSGKKGVGDPVMQELADYLVSRANVYDIQNIIYNKKAWNSRQGWHTYKIPPGGSPHLDHVHVDFKRTGNVKNISKQQNNEIVQRAVWDMYNITTKFPEKYFKRFKGSAWIPGDDKPKEAARHLIALYRLNWMDKFDKIISNGSQEELKNIETLNKAVNAVSKLIQNGDSGKVSFKFKKWDIKQQQYKTIGQVFNWQFM
jgi:hypothetical protein